MVLVELPRDRAEIEIRDFGGLQMTPWRMSFTTENLQAQNGSYVIENEGETPYDLALSTAKIAASFRASPTVGL